MQPDEDRTEAILPIAGALAALERHAHDSHCLARCGRTFPEMAPPFVRLDIWPAVRPLPRSVLEGE